LEVDSLHDDRGCQIASTEPTSIEGNGKIMFDIFYSKGWIEKKTHKLQDNPLKLEKEREQYVERVSE
jgi:hypothetical protein